MASKHKIQSGIRAATLNDVSVVPGGIFFVCLSVALVIFSVITPQAFSGLRIGLSEGAAPILHTMRVPFDKFSTMLQNTTGLAELQAENLKLKTENERLREWYQRALALQVENKSLQSLLNVHLPPEQESITVRILSDTSSSFAKTILLAGGTKQNITAGTPVISGDGVLGRVVEGGENTSRVLLLTDMNSRIPVILDSSNTHAIVSGGNDNMPTLTHLPKDTVFKKGDRLLTSGLGGIYPAGLPVGVISKVEHGVPYITPYADIQHVSFVRVIPPSKHHPNLRLRSE